MRGVQKVLQHKYKNNGRNVNKSLILNTVAAEFNAFLALFYQTVFVIKMKLLHPSFQPVIHCVDTGRDEISDFKTDNNHWGVRS